MTLENAVKSNPFDENKDTLSAYIRYLRYTVDGWNNLSAEIIKKRYMQYINKN